MKKIIFPLAILAVVGLAGCSKKGSNQHAFVPQIDVAYPEIDSLTLYRTYPGTIDASSSADVVGRVSGVILTQDYESGSYVQKGQRLFTIESTKYRDALAQAEASLATAQSNYDFYSKQYAAMKKALEADAVSQIEVEQSHSNMLEAQASIKNARAAVETARTNLGYCVVRAPISGHITSSTLNVGAFVNGEMSPVTLATVYGDNEMQVAFNIESTQYQNLIGANGGAGAPVYRSIPLNFAAPMTHTYTADLYYSSPAVDESTGTLALRGRIKNIDGELKDGMYVTVRLPYGTDSKAILVKDASIGTDQLGKYLYVVNDSNKVVYTPIEVGDLYRDSMRIVTKGITPQDRYVTKALLTVRNGEEVNPVVDK